MKKTIGMLKVISWRRKLEAAGFRVIDPEEHNDHRLAHSPGSDANLAPTDRPPSDEDDVE